MKQWKKKQFIFVSAAMVAIFASGNLWASKARLQALGQDADRGSGYINDFRNIFKNPALLSGMENTVITEWGAASGNTSTAADPGAEGGFFHNANPFAYGLYLGSDLNSQNSVRSGAANSGYAGSGISFGLPGFVARDNEIDLFLAGDMGAKWGIRLGYSKGEEQAFGTSTATHSALNLSAGTVMGNLSLYGHLSLSDESKGDVTQDSTATPPSPLVNDNAKWEGSGFEVGARYNMNDLIFTFNYRTLGADYTPGDGSVKNTTEQETIKVEAAHVANLSDSSMVFVAGAYVTQTSKDKDGTDVVSNLKVDRTSLPITMGIETNVKEWLTLRGSISQNVVLNSSKSTGSGQTASSTNQNTTNVEAGMGLNFGNLRIDGVIGNSGPDGVIAANNESGVLSLDRLMSRVALHYTF